MQWLPIDSAPRDGTPIAYRYAADVVSTCAWLGEADQPGWWDTRADEPAEPTLWCPIGPSPGQNRTAPAQRAGVAVWAETV